MRFVFRKYRLGSPVGHISMIYFLLNGTRPIVLDIYSHPERYLNELLSLKPGQIEALDDRPKRRDLKTYFQWLFMVSDEDEEEMALFSSMFDSNAAKALSFARIPFVQERIRRIEAWIMDERRAVSGLEELMGLERGKIFTIPDRAAGQADRIVKERLDAFEGSGGVLSYSTLRSYHREVDSYETTVLKSVDHEAVLRVAVSEDLFPGFYIVSSTQRFYPLETTDLCPLLIGKTGLPNERELEKLHGHRRRLEEISLIEDKGEKEMIEEESLRLLIREIDVLPDEEVGRIGLEAVLEPVLRGKRGYIIEKRGTASGRAKVLEDVPPIHGHDVILTLDAGLQRASEAALGEKGYEGAVVVMDACTGAVLALATAPRPTRQQLAREWSKLNADPRHPLIQRAIYNMNLPPPGSVFKLVTAIAALEEGKCPPHTAFECRRRIRVGNGYLHCEGSHGAIEMNEAIVRSCNIYFYSVGELLGYDILFDWAHRFGFGRSTGILDRGLYGIDGSYHGMPLEASVPLKLDESGRSNLMRFAIGQGAIDDVTPLQVARMAAGIATGRLPQPHIISYINGQPVDLPPPEELGISGSTLNFIRQSMKEVVTRGTADPDPAYDRDLRPYRVAGKTGTPQVANGPSHACFAGYLPWDDPKYSFAVFIDFCDKHGGEAAAPVLNRILESPEAGFLLEDGER